MGGSRALPPTVLLGTRSSRRGHPSWLEGILDELLRYSSRPALGAVSPETVQSLFSIIRQTEFIGPSQMRGPLRRLRRFSLLVIEVWIQALRRELGSLVDSQEVSSAVELAQQAIAATPGTGRNLYCRLEFVALAG